MKLGFFGYPRNCTGFYDALEETKKYDMKYIEPSSGNKELSPLLDEKVLLENAKKAKEALDESGIKASCFSYGCTVIGEKKETSMEHLKKLAKVCQIMEIPYLHHTLYITINPALGFPTFKEALPAAVESVREIYDYAEQLGVKCVYEDQGFVFNGCERFETFLGAVNRDVKIVADLGNIYFFEEIPEDFVGRFMPYIVHIHLKDYLRKPGSGLFPGKYWHTTMAGNYLRDTVIGHGIVEFENIFKMLLRANYEGTFSLECSGLEWANPENTAINVENARRFWENAKRSLQV